MKLKKYCQCWGCKIKQTKFKFNFEAKDQQPNWSHLKLSNVATHSHVHNRLVWLAKWHFLLSVLIIKVTTKVNLEKKMFAGSWYVLGFYNFAPRDNSSSMLPVQWSRNSWWISTHEWIWKSHIQAIEWQRRCCLLQVPCEGTVSELDVVRVISWIKAMHNCNKCSAVQWVGVRSCSSGTCSLFTDPLFSL